MPNVSLPVLAIKEANDHLQALFTENQNLECQVDEQKVLLVQKEKENTELNEQIISLNDQVSNLNLQITDLNKHVISLKVGYDEQVHELRETLKSEHERQVSVLNEEHEKQLLLLHEEHEKKMEEQKIEMENNIDTKLTEQEEFFKQEIEDTIMKENQLSKIEKQKSLHELEVSLKQLEKEKIDVLQTLIENSQNEIKMLQNEIDRLKNCLLRNTKKRESKIEILSKVFKSTVENMSLCLEIVGEDEFIRCDNFSGNSSYLNQSNIKENVKEVYLNDSNNLSFSPEDDEIIHSDSGVSIESNAVVSYKNGDELHEDTAAAAGTGNNSLDNDLHDTSNDSDMSKEFNNMLEENCDKQNDCNLYNGFAFDTAS